MRETTAYPPFSKILRLLVKSSSQEVAKNSAMFYYEKVKELKQQYPNDFFYLGVMKSPVGKIENQYRYQVLLRIKVKNACEDKIHSIAKQKRKDTTLFIETNPNNLS